MGEFCQDTGVYPYSFTISVLGFLMTTESQDLSLMSHPKDGAIMPTPFPFPHILKIKRHSFCTPVSLIPLPIIGVPFKRISMDLIGPLPKSTQGHEYMLVIMDYATKCPKAVPLQKATSCNIAKELMLLFSHVGIHMTS